MGTIGLIISIATFAYYDTRYSRYTQFIDKYVTSFWSPVGSRSEFQQQIDNCEA